MEPFPGKELLEDTKKNLLEDLRQKPQNDAVYPTQDKPMSFHLPRLIKAIEDDDIKVISEYRRGDGNWFPYSGAVEIYMKTWDDCRNTILAVDDESMHLDDIEFAASEVAPEIRIRRESTKEAALMAIAEEGIRLKALITDYSLTGSVGKEGHKIAQAALAAGVPRVVIHTGSSIQPQIWDKGADLETK